MLRSSRMSRENIEEINAINQLYDKAFPLYEQRSYQGRKAVLGQDDYYLYYFANSSIFVGFIGCWKINDYFYIEHFAISAELRGQGYGQKVLKQFCGNVGKVILEIDPVIDEISKKRLNFYQHCGFQRNRYSHTHPSYYPENKPHQLEVLSYPSAISDDAYRLFAHQLQQTIMDNSLL
ncbi:GNAT family N-acetyltransferase [Providencia rettgeri]|uniref:GNAT family N-acetyltransferase n=4 Tax=Gammaproteobacteria TaxID=1236 RepID=A0AA42K209_9GAMM|nr:MULTISPECIES: GNAT family N-acetyltransferase [Providencia]MBC8653347.1 GNAT family N-acetyltransferase [Providencia vermicola]MDG4695930.1 GNAT family N-acetyltransferase [Providencia sp. CRE-3FA-0001]HCI95953.1 GNAT family N-acetyltransferase [Providencia sp.]EIL1985157.1 GNAT family N-acetyltransferase [Providencia rettgeri]EIU7558287.1 GNAT family N-acetyltransferase [Providencia rettgeri]